MTSSVELAAATIPPTILPSAIGSLALLSIWGAVGSGLSGGPWLLPRAAVLWVVPSASGPGRLRRQMAAILGGGAATSVVLTTLVAVGVGEAYEPLSVADVVYADLSAAAFVTFLVGLAVTVHVGGKRSGAAAGALLVGVVVLASAEQRWSGSAMTLTAALGPSSPTLVFVVAEWCLAGLAVLWGLRRLDQVRLDALDRRARFLGAAGVAIVAVDVRVLRGLLGAAGAQGARAARPRPRSGHPTVDRYVNNIRRSHPRRAARVLLTLLVSAWGWWLLSHGSVVGVPAIAGALFVLGLEALEPWAQELDRPTLAPLRRPGHDLRHMAVAVVVLMTATLATAGALVPLVGGRMALFGAVTMAPACAVAGLAAAARSGLHVGDPWTLLRVVGPEQATSVLLYRLMASPVLVATVLWPVARYDEWRGGVRPLVAIGSLNVVLAASLLGLVLGVDAVRRRLRMRVEGARLKGFDGERDD